MSNLLQELSKQSKLLQLMEIRGFPLKQQNGQRTFGGPPPNWGSRSVPSRDFEVFIGKIPRLCFEDELIPLFGSAGELYEFRLLLDFSGTNRGYGYAHYATQEGATYAIKKFDKYEMRPGHFIVVAKSKNNCRLLLANIYGCFTSTDFDKFLRATTDNIVNVSTYLTADHVKAANFIVSSQVEEEFKHRVPGHNKACQFVVVEYETHKAAALARRVLIPYFGHLISIDWAIPLDEKLQGYHNRSGALQHPSQFTVSNKNTPLCSGRCSRPVPTLITPPTRLDNLPTEFGYALKYFMQLIKLNLQKCLYTMEIPLTIYFEIEEKILDRINCLEHCGPAVQLILNYLSWFNDKRNSKSNAEVHQVITEVKLYSDSLVCSLISRKEGKSANSALDRYHCEILPMQLAQLYRLGLLLLPNEKGKVYGSITLSLKFLDEIHQKARAGDERMGQIVTWIGRDRMNLNNVGTDLLPMYIKTSACFTSTDGNDVDTASASAFNNDTSSSVSISSSSGNELTQVDDLPEDGSNGEREDPKLSDSQKLLLTNDWKNVDFSTHIPVLAIRPSITDLPPFMPHSFANVVKYFKCVIRRNLQLAAEKGEIHQELVHYLDVKLVNRIKNIESCRRAISLLESHLSCKYEGILQSDLGKVLTDTDMYATKFMGYIIRKYKNVITTDEDYYYCHFLPYRLSFLYRLSLLLVKEENGKLTGRITDALVWLHELIHKIKCEDIDIKEFFNKIASIAMQKNSNENVSLVIKDAWDDYQAIIGLENSYL